MVVVLVVLLIITLILDIYSKYEKRERSRGQRANYPPTRNATMETSVGETRELFRKSRSRENFNGIRTLTSTLMDERSFVTCSLTVYANGN